MKNLVVIPTRKRGVLVRRNILISIENSRNSKFLLSVDDDDDSDYSWAQANEIDILRGRNSNMNQALNRAANMNANSFDFITFMGDDHVARTREWDLKLIDSIKGMSFGIAYGDDLIAGGNLPTAALISSAFIRTLGYMAPPILRHMYIDDFWLTIGSKTGSLRFNSDVVIEHMHHSVGKANLDSTYKSTNRHVVNLRDKASFLLYKLTGLSSDLRKLRRNFS